MFYKVYDDKLLIPAKCGSRFVSSFKWSKKEHFDFPSSESIIPLPPHLSRIKWIVLRNPHGLLESAISTEVNNRLTYIEHSPNKLNINRLKSIIGEVLDKLLTNDTPHYHIGLYKWIYKFIQSDIKHKDLKIVNLTDLSELMVSMGAVGGDKYDRYNYDHSKSPYYMSMDLIIEIVKNEFADEWIKLELDLQEQIEYWNKIESIEKVPSIKTLI